jgi:hypothetical protein
MANRNFRNDTKAGTQGLVLCPFIIACKASGAGVDTTKGYLPMGVTSVSYSTTGVYVMTLDDGWFGLAAGDLSIINSGSALVAAFPQWSKSLAAFVTGDAATASWDLTTASPTLTIHIVNTSALADPGAAFGITGALWLKNTKVAP